MNKRRKKLAKDIFRTLEITGDMASDRLMASYFTQWKHELWEIKRS